MPNAEVWWLYLIECGNGAYYTGISADVMARFDLHCVGRAAAYTRRFGVRCLVGAYPVGDRAQAMREERRVKRLHGTQKSRWVLARAVTVPEPTGTRVADAPPIPSPSAMAQHARAAVARRLVDLETPAPHSA